MTDTTTTIVSDGVDAAVSVTLDATDLASEVVADKTDNAASIVMDGFTSIVFGDANLDFSVATNSMYLGAI